MKIICYNFSKRKNSTKQPTNGVELEVVLKEGTSFHTPSFLLTNVSLGEYNYVKWDNRYYYVTDQTQVRNELIMLTCSLDYLATYKPQILNTTAMVQYSSNKYDINIDDTRIQPDGTTSIGRNSLRIANTQGAYILTFTGVSDPDGLGEQEAKGNNVVAMTESKYHEFINRINTLSSAQANRVLSSIVSLIYSPIAPPNDYLDKKCNLFIGDVQFYDYYPLKFRTNRYTVGIDIPWLHNDFRKHHRYTNLYLYIPNSGYINLDSSLLYDEDTLQINLYVDFYTGECTWNISNKVIFTNSIMSNVPLGTNNFSVGALTSIASGLVGMAVGVNTGSQMLMAHSNERIVTNAFENIRQHQQTRGNFNGMSLWNSQTNLIEVFTQTMNLKQDPNSKEYIAKYGRPTYHMYKLSVINGYCQTNGVEVDTNDNTANSTINSMLDGGVYIE